jgi:hypothetical protein
MKLRELFPPDNPVPVYPLTRLAAASDARQLQRLLPKRRRLALVFRHRTGGDMSS